jgi:hypothetical protein
MLMFAVALESISSQITQWQPPLWTVYEVILKNEEKPKIKIKNP